MPDWRKIEGTDNLRNDLRILEDYLRKSINKIDLILNKLSVYDKVFLEYVEYSRNDRSEFTEPLRYIKDDLESCLEHVERLDTDMADNFTTELEDLPED